MRLIYSLCNFISRHYAAEEDSMFTFILALHIIVAIAMIGLILIQQKVQMLELPLVLVLLVRFLGRQERLTF